MSDLDKGINEAVDSSIWIKPIDEGEQAKVHPRWFKTKQDGQMFTFGVDVEAVKQAFIDAGWFTPADEELVQQIVNHRAQHRVNGATHIQLSKDRAWELCVVCSKPVSDDHIHAGDVLTGQEWYGRFENELRHYGMIDTEVGDNVAVAEHVASVYVRAAKKAAGTE